MTNYTTSAAGITMIKRFEGYCATAYKCAAGVWTIGWGHTPSKRGQKITKAKAEKLLKQDISRFEKAVNNSPYISWTLNQNEFDALVSFAFNVGEVNLKRLCKGRTRRQVADALLLYNKAAGKTLQGLIDRRQAERGLFLTPCAVPVVRGCTYSEPTKTVTSLKQAKLRNCSSYIYKGEAVKWVQWHLNASGLYDLKVDGVCGELTVTAIMDFQKRKKLSCDGLAGKNTRDALKKAVR